MSTADPLALNIPGLRHSLRMVTHGKHDRVISRHIRECGIWEPYETSLLIDLLPVGGVFLDVGANIGYFSVLAASLVGPTGKVFAFEPDPENYRLLQANLDLNGIAEQVTAVQAALAQANGEGRLYLSEDNLGDHQVYSADKQRQSVSIKMLNGQDFLRDRLQTVDLVKVDTQGAEFQVMAGLLPLLRKLSDCPRILIELTPRSLRQAGSSGRALVELLAALDQAYWIVDHIDHRLVPTDVTELAGWCDAVDENPDDAGFMNILVGRAPAN